MSEAGRITRWVRRIGWTRPELARRLGCSAQLVKDWDAGWIAIPTLVENYLESLATLMDRSPAPSWPKDKVRLAA